VGSGAGFGACLGILLFDNHIMIQLLAFIFGLLAMFAAISMDKASKGTGTLVLVLSGIIVSSISLPSYHWQNMPQILMTNFLR